MFIHRGKDLVHGTDDMSGLLFDMAKHLSNLKYTVWEKMLDDIDYSEFTWLLFTFSSVVEKEAAHKQMSAPRFTFWTPLISCLLAPVTLDPNTAHPRLVLSDDLTSLHYTKQASSCPDNPERFHLSAEVVGMTALSSGSHHWVVDTGSNQDWLLGVASLSVSRSSETSARPENGFWTLCFRDGEFRAMTSPPTPLATTRTSKQVKVQLDYNKGTLSFFDPTDDTLFYAFTHMFTEPLLPYFYTQDSHPLRIIPEKVVYTMLRQ